MAPKTTRKSTPSPSSEEKLVLSWVAARGRIRELREEIKQLELEESTLRQAVMRLHADTYPGLTRREREVLEQIARHQSNKEIASTLHLAERTIKFHVSGLLRKFKVPNRIDLIAKLALQGDLNLSGPENFAETAGASRQRAIGCT